MAILLNLVKIKCPEDRGFLLAQEEKGHRGIKGSIKKVCVTKEKGVKVSSDTGQEIHAEEDMPTTRAVVGSLSSSTTSSNAATDDEAKGAMRRTPSLRSYLGLVATLLQKVMSSRPF